MEIFQGFLDAWVDGEISQLGVIWCRLWEKWCQKWCRKYESIWGKT